MQNQRLKFIVLGALALLLVVFVLTKKEKRAALSPAPTPSSPAPQAQNEIAKPEPAAETPSDRPDTASTPVAVSTPAPADDAILCRHIDQGRLLVPRRFMVPVLKGDLNEIVLPARLSACLVNQTPTSLVFASFDRNSQLPFRQIIEIRIQKKSFRTFKNIDDVFLAADFSPYFRAHFTELQSALMAVDPSSPKLPLHGLQFEVLEKKWTPEGFGAPREHPLAKTVDRPTVDLLTESRRAVLIDVRPSASFKRKTIPGALSIPIMPRNLRGDFVSPYQFLRVFLPESFKPLESVPKDQGLIVFDQNANSGAAYNLLGALYKLGYHKLFYFPGGFDEWTHNPLDTPSSVPGLNIVNALEVNEMLAQRPLIIDLRAQEKYRKGALPGAINLAFLETFVDEGPTLRPRDPQTLLAQTQESFSLAPPPGRSLSTPVVFLGNNEFDWRPYKAALFAKKNGWQDVYWFRYGWAQWAFAAKIKELPTEIPVVPTPTPRPPSKQVAPLLRGRDVMFAPPSPTPKGTGR